jgi:hypothetical protein
MGYMFMLSGAAITWAARKQESIAISTTEAKCEGTCNAAKEAIWVQNQNSTRDQSISTFSITIEERV